MKTLEKELDKEGIQPIQLRVLERGQGARISVNGKKFINLSSNNYLNLINHPHVKEATKKIIDEFGVGSGAARSLTGTMALHEELEEKLAAFKRKEAALLFPTGCLANQGTIEALMNKGDIIFSDELNHASIIDGCRLSRATINIFPHKNMSDLENLLEENKNIHCRKLIVTDGVFSMNGDIAFLPKIVELGKKYGAITMVDDAHALGVLGKHGHGTVEYYDLEDKIDIEMGTLSKALGALGGFIAGSHRLRDFLFYKARPILFSTSLPPPIAAAAITSLKILEKNSGILKKLWDKVKYFKNGLNSLGFDILGSKTPIIPILIGKDKDALRMSQRLFEVGIIAPAIVYPTVPEDRSRIRVIITAAHSVADLDFCLGVLEKVGKGMRLI